MIPEVELKPVAHQSALFVIASHNTKYRAGAVHQARAL